MIQVMTPTPTGEARAARRRPAIAAVETELASLTRHLERVSRRSRTYERLDRSGYLLARTLDGRGPTTIGALATELGLDATTVTRQIATMDAAGLVERSRDPRDGRACLVGLTAEGRRRMAEVRNAREERLAEVLRDWSADDRRMLGEILARLNRAIRADAPNSAPA